LPGYQWQRIETARVNVIKLFSLPTALQKARAFVPDNFLQVHIMFASKEMAYPSGALDGHPGS